MWLFPSASRNAMIVCPHKPKITSTPRRSRYSVSRYEAIRVSVWRSVPGMAFVATVLMAIALCANDRMIRCLEDLAVVKLAEQFLLRRPIFRNRPAHPGDVHVVLKGDVVVRDVAAPHAAAHARRHRHAVGEGARVRTGLHLPDHDAAHRCGERELVDVIVAVRVDAARMTLAAG